MKFPVADAEAFESALWTKGATAGTPRVDVDQYFNAPDRDFAATDEAFRVRSIEGKNFVTYKGPKRDAATKTRKETEVPLGDGPEVAASFASLLQQLGYRPVAVVRKHRRPYDFRHDGFDVHASLDEVDGVGLYAELEIMAPEDGWETARDALVALAKDLDLPATERKSYLQLLLERRGGTS